MAGRGWHYECTIVDNNDLSGNKTVCMNQMRRDPCQIQSIVLPIPKSNWYIYCHSRNLSRSYDNAVAWFDTDSIDSSKARQCLLELSVQHPARACTRRADIAWSLWWSLRGFRDSIAWFQSLFTSSTSPDKELPAVTHASRTRLASVLIA
jgi:predicted CxxxxCH...CXXCH cytochrome family protein